MITLGIGDLGYYEFGGRVKVGPTIWPHFDLLFVHEGALLLQMNGQDEVKLRTGHAILIYPHTPFYGISTTRRTRASATFFNFTEDAVPLPETFARLLGKSGSYEVHDCADHPSVEADVDRLIALAETLPGANWIDMLLSLLTLIIGQLHSEPADHFDGARGTQFQALAVWMRGNLQRTLTLDEMAEFVNLSTSHFRATFRRVLGVSPGHFLLSLRMHEACRLLVYTNLPIKDIARRVGYTDVPHFYRAFAHNINHTPQQWRQEHSHLDSVDFVGK